MTGAPVTEARVRTILQGVMDPEVPVLSVVELGIVREVRVQGRDVRITVTPTYSGCPAMQTMEEDMRRALGEAGINQVSFRTVYAPAWSTDWIPEEAKEKLRKAGIAPPGGTGSHGLVSLTLGRQDPVACPFCGSRETVLKSEFGSTACKAIHFCNACRQPFDEFKTF